MPSPTDIERAREEARHWLRGQPLHERINAHCAVEHVAPILEAPWRAEVEGLRKGLNDAHFALGRLLSEAAAVLWLDNWIKGELEECRRAYERLDALLAQPAPTAPKAEEGASDA